MVGSIRDQDNVSELKLFRINFDKSQVGSNYALDWDTMPICQSAGNTFLIFERNRDLLCRVARILRILFLFAVVALVGDLLAADLPCLRVDDHDFVAKFDV